jgi:hypothetical protein
MDVVDPGDQFGPHQRQGQHPRQYQVPDEDDIFGALCRIPRSRSASDLRGRTSGRDAIRVAPAPNRAPGPLPTASATVSNEFVDQPNSHLTQFLGVIGGKINLGGTFLLNLSLLIPMNDNGLKAKPTPVVGFDYVF